LPNAAASTAAAVAVNKQRHLLNRNNEMHDPGSGIINRLWTLLLYLLKH